MKDKIERVSLWHVALPVSTPRDHGIGLVAGNVEVVVLRIRTASGIAGWGEASPWPVFTGTPEATLSAIQRYLAPLLIGRCVSEIPAIMQLADKTIVGHPEAKAAVETALLDAFGQLCGQPVWALLGGCCRGEIPLSVSLADPEFARDLDLADRIRDAGVRIVKVKTGTQGHEFDLNRLERLKKDFPEFDIRADYNQGMQSFEAMRRLQDLDSFELGFIEQPVPALNRMVMAQLCASINTPLLADESVFDLPQAFEAARDEICNGISVKIMKCGGLRRGQQIAAVAESAGLPCYGGDMFETGIAHLAGTHMIAATPNISLGCEFYQATWYLEEDLLETPFPIENGKVQVPVEPGLGASVNEGALKKYARNACEVG
ncbi:muconate cycloisomerase [Chromatiales bacterium (ex Bugula neritina AB1)]|nr:muconate cycloisomerase [Chromatiales bacterium (ex Bugula neritina AB1)]